MTRDEIKSAVHTALRRVAPEVDPASLKTDVPIRDQADIDSMDFLNFLLELHAALGVDIPEAAYKEVATLDGCIAYLAAHGAQALAVKHGDR
jgi:acyl carrier protein